MQDEIVPGEIWIHIFFSNINGTKRMLVFDRSGEKVSKFRISVENGSVERQSRLEFYKHETPFFHQSKRGRVVKLQNKHSVLFAFPRHIMLVTTLNSQLRFISELVDWFWDVNSYPYGHL